MAATNPPDDPISRTSAPRWPADRVERRPLASLIPYARNARTHSDAQLAQLAASMKEWGWTMPVLVDDEGVLIAGHGRVLAAPRLGWTEAPVMVARGWTEGQKRAYRIADNRLALNAGWDQEMLSLELVDLRDLAFDLNLLGFTGNEIDQALGGKAGLTDPDAVPPIPDKPVSQTGDLWRLGPHRLLCGDATSADDVARVLDGVQPHLMVTDPPYGVNYDPDWRNQAYRAGLEQRGVGFMRRTIGAKAVGVVVNDQNADWRQAWSLFAGDIAYVWQGDKQITDMAAQLSESGFDLRNLIVWAKSILVIGRGHYHPQHETCWYAIRRGQTAHWNGSTKQSTLWQIDKPIRSETGHSAQKPVECMRRPIENNSSPGQAVYDPFLGSGTTIIAAEMIGRACHAIEINPAYVDVAVQRWQEFTGEEAILDGDDRVFGAVAVQRKSA